jgi:hypothetical protein|tara:strand:- start:67 stop:240 length:174 start_codon:yes stop_codon:yes gene_type:complete
MKVGDLIILTRPTTRDFNSLFIVAATIKDHVAKKPVEWIQVYGHEGWKAAKDYEVIK